MVVRIWASTPKIYTSNKCYSIVHVVYIYRAVIESIFIKKVERNNDNNQEKSEKNTISEIIYRLVLNVCFFI